MVEEEEEEVEKEVEKEEEQEDKESGGDDERIRNRPFPSIFFSDTRFPKQVIQRHFFQKPNFYANSCSPFNFFPILLLLPPLNNVSFFSFSLAVIQKRHVVEKKRSDPSQRRNLFDKIIGNSL